MNKLFLAFGLFLVTAIHSSDAIKCHQCINCPYSQVVGEAPTDCDGSDTFCTVQAESGLYNRGCASKCEVGSGTIDNNEEGLIMCCEVDGCNSAPRIITASAPAVGLLLGLFALVRL